MHVFKRAIIRLIIYILVFLGLSYINIFLGLGVLAAYILYKLYMNRAGVMSFIGRFYYARGNVDKTLEWFERAYRTGSAKPENIISYAYLLLKSGDVTNLKVFSTVCRASSLTVLI
jgi:tetratricopeptide (TPR) repeat protein